ncbi:sensor histidine kinase [Adhaeribacter soli]|uniref:histidine kinase n=1 Tax=Adhaeribacter soli TaxID=2607655 RepID=A0A5N1IIB0_9BACT|nr:ATP-binding protein [Adhaeribacter soli]KAA9325009.1 ATP-binding protein [Adhaeribacter soli]
MRFNGYRWQLILRLLLLTLTIFLFVKLNFDPDYRGTYIGLGAFALLQIGLLIRYHEQTSRQLNRFLNSVSYDDFTEQFQVGKDDALQQELALRLNEVMAKFREVRAEKEANLHYFEAIVQHIGIGIITYKPDGTILLLNKAAKKLLQTGQAKTLTELGEIDAALVNSLQNTSHNDKALVQLRQNGQLVNLSVHVIEIVLLRETIRIASVQNIQPELEEKEMEAWQNLLKVLTHEIMNSVTPIASLSASAGEEIHTLTDTEAEEITVLKEELTDIGQCLQTISRRSDGLIRFLNDFRSLNANTKLKLSVFNVVELLQEVKTLFREQLLQNNISMELDFQNESLLLEADRQLVEQVLINLIKNAAEAVADNPEKRIELKAFLDDRSRVNLEVSDNGCGLTPEAQSKIFIPFYTTKATGSGIGLSLSRQIMRLHKGAISVQSESGVGTRFLLRF